MIDGNRLTTFQKEIERARHLDDLSLSREELLELIRLADLGLWAEQSGIPALEYISCDGMDDGDFYNEEAITEGTIAMANRARSTLLVLSKKLSHD